MSILSQITLVIPTYRRQSFLDRIIHFYNDYPIQLIIVDGTEKNPWSGVKQASNNICYFHLPGESIYSRINLAMLKVKTPFCALMGDDEFQLPFGLACSAEILLKNKHVVAAIGSCVGFNVTSHGIGAGNVYGYTEKEFSSCLPQRIEEFFLHYSPTMSYALWRSGQLKQATSLISGMEWACGNLQEWIQAFCGLSQGSHVIHGQVQWLRSDENPPIQHQVNRSLEISQWWRETSFENERYVLIQRLEQFLIDILDCERNFATTLIKMAFEFMIFSDQQSGNLRLLGLKPDKSYKRIYSQSLAEVLKTSCSIPPGDSEINKLIESIYIPYKLAASL